jgi:hypothetical protein
MRPKQANSSIFFDDCIVNSYDRMLITSLHYGRFKQVKPIAMPIWSLLNIKSPC